MRRIAVIATALIVLGAATTAFAAGKLYTGSITLASKKAGTAKKPAPTAYTLQLKSTVTGSSVRPPIQLDIKTRIYGLKVDGKDFPQCSLNKIAIAKNDNVCPKKAMVASGYIHSLLGASNSFTTQGVACDPLLDVWNSGQGKLTFFFVTNAAHSCANGSLKTGATPPYSGTYKMSGKYFTSDVPVPHNIDYPAPGLVGSLQYEKLVFSTQSKKVKGKTIYSQATVGCLKNKRPYSITTTTTGGSLGTAKHTETISGSSACKG